MSEKAAKTKRVEPTKGPAARIHIAWEKLKRMMPESLDKLPMPVEFRANVGTAKKPRIVARRRRWVGFGWTDEGEATGTEPVLVTED